MQAAGLLNVSIDFGHVGIFRYLVAAANINEAAEADIFDALQRKSAGDIRALANASVQDPAIVELLLELATLHGDRGVLDRARSLLVSAPAEAIQLSKTWYRGSRITNCALLRRVACDVQLLADCGVR